jgi:hypothetical protein
MNVFEAVFEIFKYVSDVWIGYLYPILALIFSVLLIILCMYEIR